MRRLLVRLHLWLGLAIGLLWALQGLTGAMLVFHREVDRLAMASVADGPMTSLERIGASVEASVGARPERIGIADGRGDLLTAEYRTVAGERRSLLVEARSARIVGDRAQDPDSPFEGAASRWLYTLHEALLLGERGETLIGISGLFLFSMTVTGLWIGWPRRGSWRAAAAPRLWRTTRQRLYGWHRLIGLGAGLLLLLTVPAGIYMIFSAEIRPALARVVPHRLAYLPQAAPTFGSATVSADAALGSARRLFPGAAFVRIAMPSAKSPAYMIRLRQAGETRAWSGVTAVWIDARSGATLSVYDPLVAPLSNRLADAAFSVHSGEIGRLPGRLLVMLAGLSLPVLYATGVWAWWRKRRKRKLRGPALEPLPAE